METGIALVVGLLIGGGLVAVVFGARLKDAQARLAGQDSELAALRAQESALAIRCASLQTELEKDQALFAERQATWGAARDSFADAFKVISADALAKNNQSFLELARAALEAQRIASADSRSRSAARSISCRPSRACASRTRAPRITATAAPPSSRPTSSAMLSSMRCVASSQYQIAEYHSGLAQRTTASQHLLATVSGQQFIRHSGAGRNPEGSMHWAQAFAGATGLVLSRFPLRLMEKLRRMTLTR